MNKEALIEELTRFKAMLDMSPENYLEYLKDKDINLKSNSDTYPYRVGAMAAELEWLIKDLKEGKYE